MQEKKYCKLCGSKLQPVETSYFDENTGKKVIKLVCPKVGCTRNCHFYGCDLTKHLFKTSYCKKCGEIPYSECY